jgi:heme/copper-type cytochrome/quinol oxidase subunit 2
MIGTRTAGLAYAAPPRVNLLPPAERERREQADLVRRWIWVAVAVAVAVVLVTAATTLVERTARSHLDDERARTTTLVQELTRYQDVSAAVRDKSSYTTYRATAMAADLAWAGLLQALSGQVPKGAAITGFDAVVGDAATTSGGGATGATSGGTAGSTGMVAPTGTAVTVTLTVTSTSPVDQQKLVSGLQQVPGVLGVDLSRLSSESYPSYAATSTVYLDASVYSGRYTEAKP